MSAARARGAILASLLLFALSLGACAMLGDETRFPFRVTTSGVGPFRQLESYETGVTLAPKGQAVASRSVAMQSGMVAEGQLFFAAAPMLMDAPPRDESLAEWEIDPLQIEPLRLMRARAIEQTGTLGGRTVPLRGFQEPTLLLEASEAWEGSELFDPHLVILDDGRARLYYAAAGGIGVAEASSAEGAFSRIGSEPILDQAQGAGPESPRSPSLLRMSDGRWWMYYDAGDGIRLASSEDGLRFAPIDGDETTAELDPLRLEAPAESLERGLGMPSALVAETPSGRRLIRLYFEVRLDEGPLVSMAASEDGVHFERYEGASFAIDAPGAPRVQLLEGGQTLLLASQARAQLGIQLRALVFAVTPSAHLFADEPE
ncbi:MAG: hypothetical protein OEY14_04475 [Myxococcales bacterium]|nr:hypothetical protein [Myxococcales bacterium]